MPRKYNEDDEENTHKIDRSRDRYAPDDTPHMEKKSEESQQNKDPDKVTQGSENHMSRKQTSKGRHTNEEHQRQWRMM